MARTIKKITHNGVAYYTVGDAAVYLGTTAIKVREFMGDGSLKWAQLRVNGKLLITAQSLMEKKHKK